VTWRLRSFIAVTALTTAVLPGAANSGRDARRPSDPPAHSARYIRLVPTPASVVEQCRRVQAAIHFRMLCPRLLPRALIGSPPGQPPPPLESGEIKLNQDSRPVGVDIGYGAPWEGPQARQHLWRNRPCCFLHFVIQRGRTVAGARLASLGGRRGRLLPANRATEVGPYFGNHVRFFFSERGVPYVATLHSFGNAETTALLGRLIAGLRPADALRVPPGPAKGKTLRLASPGPRAIATTQRTLWVLSRDKPIHNYPSAASRGELVEINPGNGHIRSKIKINGNTRGLIATDAAVWVATAQPISASQSDGVVLRIDPSTDRVVARISTGTWPAALAVGPKGVWVVNTAPFFKQGTLVHIDAATNRTDGRSVPLGPAPSGVAVGQGAVWVADAIQGTVRRIDVRQRRVVATIRVGHQPYALAYTAGSIWVTNSDDKTVSRIDASTNKVVATIRVPRNPYGMAASPRAVWISDLGAGTIVRIDASTGRIDRAIRVGGDPLGVALASGAVWVSQNSDGAVTRFDPAR
jgi:YVTN family beta-propeller protein